MRNYELVYIISPEIEEEDLESVTDKVGQMLADGGGQMLHLDAWGRRRLAYPIRNFGEGHYMVAQVQLEPETISELKGKLGLTEEVIRYLLVKVDEKKAAALAAEPQEEPLPEEAEAQPQEEPVEEQEAPEEAEEEEGGD